MWLRFFVAMHHCSKLFAVLQHLFAAKQQIFLCFQISLLFSMTYEAKIGNKKPRKSVDLLGLFEKYWRRREDSNLRSEF